MSAIGTSREAYHEMVKNGKANTQLNIILNHLRENGSKTRRELSKELEIETSTISARVNKLKNLHYICDTKKTICSLSKKNVGLVEVCNA